MPVIYEVVVGNIGKVYEGPSRAEAEDWFNAYMEQSSEGIGRAGGEDVTILRRFVGGGTDLVREHIGANSYAEL